MSTHANIRFNDGETTYAHIYRHFDGYPDTAGRELLEFLDVMAKLNDTRFGDPSYLAFRYLAWTAVRKSEASKDCKWAPPQEPHETTGFGIIPNNWDDEEFSYTVDCSKTDTKGRPLVTLKQPGYEDSWEAPVPAKGA